MTYAKLHKRPFFFFFFGFCTYMFNIQQRYKTLRAYTYIYYVCHLMVIKHIIQNIFSLIKNNEPIGTLHSDSFCLDKIYCNDYLMILENI